MYGDHLTVDAQLILPKCVGGYPDDVRGFVVALPLDCAAPYHI